MFELTSHPHRRYNPLTGTWVLVSPHRATRPWQGQVEKTETIQKPAYDPQCYLCPGNQRAGGVVKNPQYQDTYAFTNDFSALKPDVTEGNYNLDNLLLARAEKGTCRVICFSPHHNKTLPEMEVSAIRKVVDLWCEEFVSLSQSPDINYIQIFENKGQIMGCSNPHPHGQIWAQNSLPGEIEKKMFYQKKYYQAKKTSLLSDYLAIELREGLRLVRENDSFVALVPFWAVWPFETMILSRRSFSNLSDMSSKERQGLADIIRQLTICYDNLFETSFPYSAGIHQSPCDGEDHPEWHFHMCFYPPLLRSATVKKFMVGYEMLGEPQRDISAEKAAESLRTLPKLHYLIKSGS